LFELTLTTQPLPDKVLKQLYKSTNGPYWTNSTNWMMGDACNAGWFGVMCFDGQVIGLYAPISLASTTISLPTD
jgi:hypothetical protein